MRASAGAYEVSLEGEPEGRDVVTRSVALMMGIGRPAGRNAAALRKS